MSDSVSKFAELNEDLNLPLTPSIEHLVTDYKLNVNNIHDLEDVKDILEAMDLHITAHGNHLNPIQKSLVEKGLFEEVKDE